MAIDWSGAGKQAGFKLETRLEEGSIVYVSSSDGILLKCGSGAFNDYIQVAEPNQDGRTGCLGRNLHHRGWDFTEGQQYTAAKVIKTQEQGEQAFRDIVDFLETHSGD